MFSSTQFRRIQDDRGRVVEVRWGNRDVPPFPRWMKVLTLGSLPFLFGALWLIPLSLAVKRWFSADAAAWVMLGLGVPAAITFFAATTMLLYTRWPSRERKRVVAWRAGHGRCRACDYSLGGLVKADDECIVCPECGAAWREARAAGLG